MNRRVWDDRLWRSMTDCLFRTTIESFPPQYQQFILELKVVQISSSRRLGHESRIFFPSSVVLTSLVFSSIASSYSAVWMSLTGAHEKISCFFRRRKADHISCLSEEKDDLQKWNIILSGLMRHTFYMCWVIEGICGQTARLRKDWPFRKPIISAVSKAAGESSASKRFLASLICTILFGI